MTLREDAASTDGSRLTEAGIFLVVVGVPLVFFPQTTAPFVDAKLMVLLTGCVLIAAARPRAEARLGALAAVWLGALALTSAVGLAPEWSLLGAEDQGNGLALYCAAAFLLVTGATLHGDVADRLPLWMLNTGAAISAIELAGTLRPSLVAGKHFGLDFGSTLGQPVFAGGVLAAAVVVSATAGGPQRLLRCVLCSSGLVVSANRAGLVGAVAGLALLCLAPSKRRAALRVSLILACALVGWSLVTTSVVGRFAEVGHRTSLGQRFLVWRGYSRAFWDSPILGNGLATGAHTHLKHSTAEELVVFSESWTDPHNLPLEIASGAGLLGLLPFIALAVIVVWRASGTLREGRWATAATVALIPTQLTQPVGIATLSLFCVFAGLAVRGRSAGRLVSSSRPIIFPVGILLVLSVLRVAAGTLEQYSNQYTSAPALRTALLLQPWRLTAVQELLIVRAQDARAGNSAARQETLTVAERAIREHKWHPATRRVAAEAAQLMNEAAKAEEWLDSQLVTFPRMEPRS